MLIARSRKGIHFSELAPSVHAVFVLIGARDRRADHLYALSAIAEAVQQTHFQERWLHARNETTLRNILHTRKGG
jgi:mannitol/fructose-specific phosphotransferase system IIA component (Ntr-type)